MNSIKLCSFKYILSPNSIGEVLEYFYKIIYFITTIFFVKTIAPDKDVKNQ